MKREYILGAIVLGVCGSFVVFKGLVVFWYLTDQVDEAVPGQNLEPHHVAFLEDLLATAEEEEILWLYSMDWPDEIDDTADVITTQRWVRYWKIRSQERWVERLEEPNVRLGRHGDRNYLIEDFAFRSVANVRVYAGNEPLDGSGVILDMADGSSGEFHVSSFDRKHIERVQADVLAAAKKLRDR